MPFVHSTYPYLFYPCDTTDLSPLFKSHRLVPPIRHSVLGRTYGMYLHYKRSYSINVFYYSEVRGAEAPQKRQIYPSDRREKSPRSRLKIPAISGIFPRDFGDFPPRFWVWKMPKCAYCLGAPPKCAYRLGAPDAMMMMRTATSVLHDARTRCSMLCDGRNPAESGGHDT